ncbi:copper amine oxidase N-terminal domain-containing protein [Heliorestis acidaminivorans]|uniref:Copper amine oxidase N-terminal domain-containing protein n=1 Tax=Heliorestis acidaminivorans TaxID=553427 RepID=A0A6I0EYU4_9FIRM|nr:copper amine oxidase N-terminal domain-containing protein [Heliorestis acidaminivorans]KAB2953676.1 copper amine oxidase N-terminal domain-containing protein [Heliorestis acidaminivorans]
MFFYGKGSFVVAISCFFLFSSMFIQPILIQPIWAEEAKVVTSDFASSYGDIPVVYIGHNQQQARDITLTEVVPESLMARESHNELRLYLPLGISFEEIPSFKIVEGDALISAGSVTTRYDRTGFHYASATIVSSSSSPTRILISNINLRVSRSVPSGDVVVKIKGTALNETTGFANDTVEEVVIASAQLPDKWAFSPYLGDRQSEKEYLFPTYSRPEVLHFTVGEETYWVEDEQREMDVVPYIEGEHLYLPLRFLLEGIGLSDEDILWDGNSETLTIFSGLTFIQLTVGDSSLRQNGLVVDTMEAPLVLSESGRLMVPLRAVAERLGYEVSWDGGTGQAHLRKGK